jgi:hypothetical protein
MTGTRRSPLTGTEAERRVLARWAGECVERILPLYEQRFPHDNRPRAALAAGRAFAESATGVDDARRAALGAHAAARWTADPVARATARAAAHAAAVAHVASHARHAAGYVEKAVVAASPGDAGAGVRERRWQYQHASDLVRSWAFPDGPP